ncbi:DUF4396 domain-containing protein [Nocardia sp. ET3-3]|uniref:DUF4396 domain-containing protein n=1 Tax=Nocardia terrae TaxID=2675851 RepID=A0A7K1V4K3_9NOCA|nr:DUF4396 domain-containing protein [Nocardia terrae]
MVPVWLYWLAWSALLLAGAGTVVVLYDIFGRGYRQRMRVMEAVWPVTALYLGPIAVWAYRRYGRTNSPKWLAHNRTQDPRDKPRWAVIAVGVGHCGAGCTLGDILAEFAVFALGVEWLGRALWPEFVGDYLAALALGILFQYLAIAPMRGLRVREGLVRAAKADVLSLTAFEVGLFGWMALMSFVFFPNPHLRPDSVTYWFLMQIGMVIGFATAWPANVWLIRHGIKEAM